MYALDVLKIGLFLLQRSNCGCRRGLVVVGGELPV